MAYPTELPLFASTLTPAPTIPETLQTAGYVAGDLPEHDDINYIGRQLTDMGEALKGVPGLLPDFAHISESEYAALEDPRPIYNDIINRKMTLFGVAMSSNFAALNTTQWSEADQNDPKSIIDRKITAFGVTTPITFTYFGADQWADDLTNDQKESFSNRINKHVSAFGAAVNPDFSEITSTAWDDPLIFTSDARGVLNNILNKKVTDFGTTVSDSFSEITADGWDDLTDGQKENINNIINRKMSQTIQSNSSPQIVDARISFDSGTSYTVIVNPGLITLRDSSLGDYNFSNCITAMTALSNVELMTPSGYTLFDSSSLDGGCVSGIPVVSNHPTISVFAVKSEGIALKYIADHNDSGVNAAQTYRSVMGVDVGATVYVRRLISTLVVNTNPSDEPVAAYGLLIMTASGDYVSYNTMKNNAVRTTAITDSELFFSYFNSVYSSTLASGTTYSIENKIPVAGTKLKYSVDLSSLDIAAASGIFRATFWSGADNYPFVTGVAEQLGGTVLSISTNATEITMQISSGALENYIAFTPKGHYDSRKD